MPSNRLEEIREREAKATPGNWAVGHCFGRKNGAHAFYEGEACSVVVADKDFFWWDDVCGKRDVKEPREIFKDASYDECHHIISEPNAQFIAHARQDIPYLLERLRLAEAVVTATKKWNEWQEELCPEGIESAFTAYDAFLSASNPEAGGGKG